MTEIIIERVSIKGRNWVRTHATDTECSALCTKFLEDEIEPVELGEGKITCPDCIEIIKKCKAIPDTDQQPEYENEFFLRR